jgi:hypothetical protein
MKTALLLPALALTLAAFAAPAFADPVPSDGAAAMTLDETPTPATPRRVPREAWAKTTWALPEITPWEEGENPFDLFRNNRTDYAGYHYHYRWWFDVGPMQTKFQGYYDPGDDAKTLTAIDRLGSIGMVTWEPWLATFESARHAHLPLREARDRHGLAHVARGDYDFYIDAWVTEAARFGKPVFVRLAHEMNDAYRYPWGPQHNTKEEFIAAWRHVVERARAAGATNIIWVWSPHVAYQFWELYYPGDAYVDWVATGVLNFGPIAQWSQWWSFAEIFGKHYPELKSFGKPIMVAEFGSLAVGGDRAAWYDQALRALPTEYPAVRALLFFNVQGDQTVTYQKVDWTVTGDSALVRVIADALSPVATGGR